MLRLNEFVGMSNENKINLFNEKMKSSVSKLYDYDKTRWITPEGDFINTWSQHCNIAEKCGVYDMYKFQDHMESVGFIYVSSETVKGYILLSCNALSRQQRMTLRDLIKSYQLTIYIESYDIGGHS